MRLPTQGPHGGDDTRAPWPVSMKAGWAGGRDSWAEVER